MNTKKKENRIIENHGDWLEVDVSTPKHPDAVMMIDKFDYFYIKAIGAGYIRARELGRNTYAYCSISRKSKRVHRLIVEGVEIIDHINRDGLDNRRSNLRACTATINCVNSRVQKNNKSGVRGVRWRPDKGRWVAQININDVTTHVGSFVDFFEAVCARKSAEIEYYGGVIA